MEADGDNEEVHNESKYRSTVWQYFEDVSRKDWIAKCRKCNKPLSYRSLSNLRKHLNRKHPEMIEKLSDEEGDEEVIEEVTYLDEESGEIGREPDVETPFDKRKILRNGAWEYFEVLDEEKKLATCTICREQFSYRTTSTNLAKHLKRRHCIEFEKVSNEDYTLQRDDDDDDDDNEDDDESDDKKSASHSDKRRANPSVAWEFFTIIDHGKRVAQCKLCEKMLSYLTSVSNLMKHARVRHGIKTRVEPDGSRRFEEDDENKQDLRSVSRSSVWLYFKCIDPVLKLAVCLICKKQLSHLTSITNLKKHLYRKHPGVQLQAPTNGKKMLIASDGQLYEIAETAKREQDEEDNEQTEPLELNTIYLDDYDDGSPPPKRAKPPRRIRPLEETLDTETLSSDEEITFSKKYVRKKPDSLDQFGKYLVSLLKQLPKELSNQLQADFVKQVMGAQLSFSSTAPVSGYAITITEPPPLNADINLPST